MWYPQKQQKIDLFSNLTFHHFINNNKMSHSSFTVFVSNLWPLSIFTRYLYRDFHKETLQLGLKPWTKACNFPISCSTCLWHLPFRKCENSIFLIKRPQGAFLITVMKRRLRDSALCVHLRELREKLFPGSWEKSILSSFRAPRVFYPLFSAQVP